MYRELSFRISQEYNGRTIEKFLKEYAGFTKKQISQAKFRPGGFCVNGIQKRCTQVLQEEEILTVCIEEAEKGSVHLVDSFGRLQVLYEDQDVLVVHKPAGVLCHPTKGHFSETLANQVAAYYREKRQMVTVRPIGRLDAEVSGAVVFGKNQMAAARLGKQREAGVFQKEYLALVGGRVEKELLIKEPIGPHEQEIHKMQVSPRGKPACTRVTPLEIRQDKTLVQCVIYTGRTHQIRVHLSFLGHPIVGDFLYGGLPREDKGICLHAQTVYFVHPFTREKVEVAAPPVSWGQREDWKC